VNGGMGRSPHSQLQQGGAGAAGYLPDAAPSVAALGYTSNQSYVV
jgi:hypothetical protein